MKKQQDRPLSVTNSLAEPFAESLISNILKVLNEVLPPHLVKPALIKTAILKSIDYAENRIERIDFQQDRSQLQEIFSHHLSSEAFRFLDRIGLQFLQDECSDSFSKSIRNTQGYGIRVLPWAITKCGLTHRQIDSFLMLILFVQLHYDILEDFLDCHNRISRKSILALSPLYSLAIDLMAEVTGDYKLSSETLGKYHLEYLVAEKQEKERTASEAAELWSCSDLVSWKASPAKILFAVPLLLSNQENLISEYERIIDHWALHLQLLDDVMDIEDDLEKHCFGMGVGLLDWFQTEKGYSRSNALRSLQAGTGFKIVLAQCRKELESVKSIALKLDDYLIVYEACFRLHNIEKLWQRHESMINKG